jgi:hypothetical protein
MPDDQQIRRELIAYADRVPVDVESDLDLVLDAGHLPGGRGRRAALVGAVSLLVAVLVAGILVGGGLVLRRGAEVAAPPQSDSGLTGTWVRSLRAGNDVPDDASGTWTMVLGADGSLTLVPPERWAAANSQPNGVYVREGDAFRTNVLAGELCAGSAGAYVVDLRHSTVDLRASTEPCAVRASLLEGRWDRAP